jgi:hypothetical protein
MEIDRINTPLAVIESPLSGDFIRNKRYAVLCCQYCLLELKMIPYASHLFFPQFLDDTNIEHRKIGIEAGFGFARKAEYRLFFIDFGMSNGMKLGLEDANDNNQIVKYHTLPESYMKVLYSSKPIGTPTKGFI